jgi:hypothetical protein
MASLKFPAFLLSVAGFLERLRRSCAAFGFVPGRDSPVIQSITTVFRYSPARPSTTRTAMYKSPAGTEGASDSSCSVTAACVA